MEFDIDNDGNVRVDGTPQAGYDVVDTIDAESDVTLSEGVIVFYEADPATGVHAGASRPTTVTYGGVDNQIFETATAEDPDVTDLKEYAHRAIQRRVIFAQFHVAGCEAVERVPVAIESSFKQGVFITLPSFSS